MSSPLAQPARQAAARQRLQGALAALLYAVPSASGDVVGNPQLRAAIREHLRVPAGLRAAGALSLSTRPGLQHAVDDKTEFVQQGINKVARNVARAATLSWETMAELQLPVARCAPTSASSCSGPCSGPGRRATPARWSAHARAASTRTSWSTAAWSPSRPASRCGQRVQASYIGARRASDNNILLNGGAYVLPAYVLLEASLATSGFDLFGRQRHEVSFSLSGKNLLGATGPTPGFSGVDYPLAPRAFFLQMNLAL